MTSPDQRPVAVGPLRSGLLHLLFPSPCRVCGGPLDAARRSLICGRCWEGMRLVRGAVCPRCGWPFPSPIALAASPGHLCGRCRGRTDRFLVARAVALYEREGAAQAAILLLKHGRRPSLARHLGRLMAEELPRHLEGAAWDGLVPVPLHWRRRWDRGYNQAVLLAREVGRRHGLPLVRGALRRRRATPPQEGDAAERIRNVRDAFRVPAARGICGRRLLLIDDVFTTGATANECARALLDAGAEAVGVYTFARVP